MVFLFRFLHYRKNLRKCSFAFKQALYTVCPSSSRPARSGWSRHSSNSSMLLNQSRFAIIISLKMRYLFLIFRYQYENISIYIINASKICAKKKRRNISPSNSTCICMFVLCMKTLMRIDPSSTQAALPNEAGEKPDWTRSPCGQNGDGTMPESFLLESLCLVTPSSGSERQQVSKHMWEEDTKQREERLQDCSE